MNVRVFLKREIVTIDFAETQQIEGSGKVDRFLRLMNAYEI